MCYIRRTSWIRNIIAGSLGRTLDLYHLRPQLLVTTDEPLVHYDATKVVLGELRSVPQGNEKNEIAPVQSVRIITVNGQIWERDFFAFGMSEEAVIKQWNMRELHKWRKIELNEPDKK